MGPVGADSEGRLQDDSPFAARGIASAESPLCRKLPPAELAGEKGQVSRPGLEPVLIQLLFALFVLVGMLGEALHRVESSSQVNAPCELPLRLREEAQELAFVTIVD